MSQGYLCYDNVLVDTNLVCRCEAVASHLMKTDKSLANQKLLCPLLT